jgi:hypothetical protein
VYVASYSGNGNIAKITPDGATVTTFVNMLATGRTSPSF